MKKSTLSIVSLVVVFAALDLAGQKPTNGTNNNLEITANLMVLDQADKFVSDVKAEDLRLYENDVEQTIVSLETNPPKLSLMLVVDNTGSMRSQFRRVHQATGIASLI